MRRKKHVDFVSFITTNHLSTLLQPKLQFLGLFSEIANPTYYRGALRRTSVSSLL
jgi:hypothetical protein